MSPRRIILLGATGSIGSSTLDVVSSHQDLFEIVAMSAHSQENSLLEASKKVAPSASLCLSGRVPTNERIEYANTDGLIRMIRDTTADIVINGIAGARGLEFSLAAIESGKHVALANKETMVLAGRIVLELAQKRGVRIIPVDSEHSAVFQMVERFGTEALDEITLTASGGTFRDREISDLENVTPEEASRHPNWRMGRKITIDSSSMANKGLEVIEAVRFFNMKPDRVRVLIHPQSQVHALIRMRDGALYAQITGTDMRMAIQQALSWPSVNACAFGGIDLAGHSLTFQNPDMKRYPLLKTAYEAVEAGEGYTVAYNAADEIAVEHFIQRHIKFTDIARVVASTLDRDWPSCIEDIQQVHQMDSQARRTAEDVVKGF